MLRALVLLAGVSGMLVGRGDDCAGRAGRHHRARTDQEIAPSDHPVHGFTPAARLARGSAAFHLLYFVTSLPSGAFALSGRVS
jgi:hypothetical protein